MQNNKNLFTVIGLCIICFALILFNSCTSEKPLIESRTHFTLKRGSKKGEVGKAAYRKGRYFPLDRQLFNSQINVDFNRLSLLDRSNQKIMQFELNGALVGEYSLKKLAEKNKVQFLHLAVDEDHHIYFSGYITDGTTINYTVWYLKNFKSKALIVYKQKIERTKQYLAGHWHYKLYRPFKLFSIAENRCVVIWEKLTRNEPLIDKYNATEQRTITDVTLIDVSKKRASRFSIDKKLFPSKLDKDYKLTQIATVAALYNKEKIGLELIYVGKNRQQPFRKKIAIYSFNDKSARVLPLQQNGWSAFYGISTDNRIFLLDSTEYSQPIVHAIFKYIPLGSKDGFYFRIKSDPSHSQLGNLYFAHNGKIFSFIPSLKGITLISWN